MLHIVRHHWPDAVVIVLTTEMAVRSKQDNRYARAITELSCLYGKQPPDIILKETGIDDPSDFEAFVAVYRNYITEIVQDDPETEIIVNVSSGSPQMIATACLLASSHFLGKTYRCIQVLHHRKRSGEASKYMDDSYTDTMIGQLLDADPDADNRCREPNLHFFTDTLLKQQLKQLILCYDYNGAAELCKHHEYVFRHPFSSLVQSMDMRLKQNLQRATQLLADWSDLPKPIKSSARPEAIDLYEYCLGSQVCYLRKEMGTFLLRLSPLLTGLIQYYITINCRFQLDRLINNNGNVAKLDANKIAYYEQQLLNYLNKQYPRGYISDPISLNSMLHVLSYLNLSGQAGAANLSEVLMQFTFLREVEEKLRNKVAHQIVKVDDAWCHTHTGSSFAQIHNALIKLFSAVIGPYLNEGWQNFPDRYNTFVTLLIDAGTC